MELDGHKPKPSAYKSLLAAMAAAGEVRHTLDLFREMGDKGLERDAEDFALVTDLCARVGRCGAVGQAWGLWFRA